MPNFRKGYFKYILAVDTETTGYYPKNLHVTHTPPNRIEACEDFEEYQILSIGLIVASVKTFAPIEKLYLEIKWNGKSTWNMKAQNIHGLTKEYLEEHGITEEEAVVQIAQLILKYWGPTGYLVFLGHNITFDIQFLDRLMSKFGIQLNISGRFIDTNSLGMATVGSFTSDELFDKMGLPIRDKHNSMEDIEYTLQSAAIIKKQWGKLDNLKYD